MRIDHHIFIHEDDRVPPWAVDILGRLAQIDGKLVKEAQIMSQMDDELKQAAVDASAMRGAVDSAVSILNTISQKIADAIAAALAAGATPEQLQAVTDLDSAMKTTKSDLEAAIANSQTV